MRQQSRLLMWFGSTPYSLHTLSTSVPLLLAAAHNAVFASFEAISASPFGGATVTDLAPQVGAWDAWFTDGSPLIFSRKRSMSSPSSSVKIIICLRIVFSRIDSSLAGPGRDHPIPVHDDPIFRHVGFVRRAHSPKRCSRHSK